MHEDVSPGESPHGSAELESLVADWLARHSLGDANALEDLCVRHPQHSESLRRRVAKIAELGLATTERAPAADEAVGLSPPAERLARLREQTQSASARYEILDEIGRGGMGIVLRVRDLGLGRGIAMKVVGGDAEGLGVDSDVLQRFLDEAQITGQIDHPGVVPVHELGVDGAGRPFFTMRLVRGETADKVFAMARAGEGGWTETRALEVILKVCDTMAFAHQKGVLHRDLKPGNVMVGRFGEVYVLDWGLAKVRGRPDPRDLRFRPESTVSRVHTDRSKAEAESDSPLLTMDGAVVGTPSYMSPEQAEGHVEILDERADVYAVGAMLYQLLTGWQPYVRPGARVSPYAVLAAVHAGPPAAAHSLRRDVPAELAAICERAMARDLKQRYASMRELSDDLRAYMEKRVVKAYRTGPVAELLMWVRRNRALAGALAAAAVALVGGIVATGLFARRASSIAAEQKQQLVQASWGAFNQADRLFAQAAAPGSTGAGIAAAREGLLHLARAVSFDPTNRVAWERFTHEASHRKALWRIPNEVAVFAHDGLIASATFSPDGTRVLTASGDKTAKLWTVRSATLLHTFAHNDRVQSATFSPSGRQVLTASRDKTAKLWSAGSARLLYTFAHEGEVWSATFSSDGARVLTASSDKTGCLWDAASGEPLYTFTHGDTVWSATFSPNGARVLTASSDKTGKLWDATSGRLVHTFIHDGDVVSATFSPDGTRVLTASRDKTGKLWDAATGNLVFTLAHGDTVWSARFSPDGTRVLTASNDETAKLWDIASQRPMHTFMHGGWVASGTFSLDGTRVLTASEDKAARLWDVGSGKLMQTFTHELPVWSATFSSDGTCVLTVSLDKTAKVWDAASGSVADTLAHNGAVWAATFSPDGRRVATASDDVRLWDRDGGELMHTLVHGSRVYSATFSPDATRVVTASADRCARVWDSRNGSEVHTFRHEDEVMAAIFSPDGTRVATASRDKTAKLWDTRSGELVHTFAHEAAVYSACFDPHATHVLTASADRSARLWQATSGLLMHAFAHDGEVQSAAFSPDGTRVLTASADKSARLWDAASGKLVRTFAHGSTVWSARFSPDGTRVLTASHDQTAKLWDVSGQEPVHTFMHDGWVASATFSPDGTRALTAGEEKTARLWDLGSGKLVHTLAHETQVWSATFSPDGTRVLTASLDNTAKLWDLRHVRPLSTLAGPEDIAHTTSLAETLTGQSLSTQAELTALSPERRAHLRATWQTLRAAEPPFGPLVRWLDAHGPESQAHPGSSMTCRERAGILIANGGAIGAREALQLDPGHPLVHIALAAHESVPEEVTAADRPAMEAAATTRREFLRDYGLRRLPADAAVCARAAAMLLAQGDRARALQAANKALALEPTHAEARRTAADARR